MAAVRPLPVNAPAAQHRQKSLPAPCPDSIHIISPTRPLASPEPTVALSHQQRPPRTQALPPGPGRQHKKTQSDAVIINFLGNHNRPDIAQEAFDNPPGRDSEDEESKPSPPTASDMTAAFETASLPHFNHHASAKAFGHREDPMASTRPRSGGSAPLDMIINSDPSQQNQPRPRLDTSVPGLASSSIGHHLLPAPASAAPSSSSSSSSSAAATKSQAPVPVLPSLKDLTGPLPGPLSGRELPPPNGHSHFNPGSALPSPASDLASARTPQFPSLGKSLSATTPPLSYRSQPSPPTSIRSPHRSVHDATSPRSHFATAQGVRVKPLSPQSEATTPASVFSSTSFQSPNGSMVSNGDAMQVDSNRPILPPPLPTAPGMNTPGMVFRCKQPGCTAPPFQTQYLLNSHMNVHSSSRPHYCPRKGCPRGEGGKGFKRKNEMIRHGLVHQSPGYACPFCPDREHKYPRPDNLQRHVKVHHVDKDKDDPVLRDVLNQRLDGGSRGRRRRANS